MNWILKFYPGDGTMLLAANALAQAILAILLAWLIGAVLARRNAAVRYALCVAALAVTLASPATAFVADRLGLATISFDLGLNRPAPVPQAAAARPTPVAPLLETSNVSDLSPIPAPVVAVPPSAIGKTDVAPAPAPKPIASSVSATLAVPPSVTAGEIVRGVLAAVLAVWAAGSLFLLARMIHGWGVLTSLRHELKPFDGRRHGAVLARVRAALGVEKLPPIMLSGIVGSPITVGLFRPAAVLPKHLPQTISTDELADILTHECAHIIQRDHWIGFIQRLVEMIFWPLPLVHLLNRHLSAAREEVCDNYVLRRTEPQKYARCLVDLASKTTVYQKMPATACLVQPRWRMEDRIKGLVDNRRKLMTRLNTWVLLAVAAAFLGTSVIVAGVGVARAGDAENKTRQPTTSPTTAPATSEKISWGQVANDGVRFGVSPNTTTKLPLA
ncbi:MAG: M56 family metallopeptidase [Planctomycetes bacterium]|nr:M56 family metallopeptidase [Planctomycetota bacterium]